MKPIKAHVRTDASGKAQIQLNTEYRNTELDLIIVIEDPQLNPNEKRKYDFSDLVGKLKWKGDALEMQRALRDEWK